MKFPTTLLLGYILLFIACGITPYDRGVWVAENLPILILVAGIIVFSRYHTFSKLAYCLMAVLVTLHTIGGHYTFERVPFDFITNTFGFERNHYDRIAHFSVGFYAFAIAELLATKELVRGRTILYLFPIFTILSVAAIYEIFEWQFALMADPEAGLAVLGSQGDIWDAQKDMLADGLGAVLAVVLYALLRSKSLRQDPS